VIIQIRGWRSQKLLAVRSRVLTKLYTGGYLEKLDVNEIIKKVKFSLSTP
jgi:hypothetical protein